MEKNEFDYNLSAAEVDITTFKLPAYNEITNVGLYLKQVVKFINEALQTALDITVTETMLSNYVKLHLVSNPVKKQYSRDQIATLIMITLTKNAVSLDNLQLLINMQKDFSVEDTYTFFREAFSNALADCFSPVNEAAPGNAYTPNSTDGNDLNEGRILLNSVITTVAHEFYIRRCFLRLKQTQTIS